MFSGSRPLLVPGVLNILIYIIGHQLPFTYWLRKTLVWSSDHSESFSTCPRDNPLCVFSHEHSHTPWEKAIVVRLYLAVLFLQLLSSDHVPLAAAFTYVHLTDMFIQRDLQCSQWNQFMFSLGIKQGCIVSQLWSQLLSLSELFNESSFLESSVVWTALV